MKLYSCPDWGQTLCRVGLLVCLLATSALAQEISVSRSRLTAGESVRVQGSDLPPGSQVTAQLTAPGGEVSRESVQVGEAGRFTLETPLEEVGAYQLVVRGQGLDETRVLEVRAENAPARASPSQTPPPATSSPDPNPATPPVTEPNAPAEPASTEAAPLTVTRIENGLEATRNGTLRWRLPFPAGSGPTTAPLPGEGELYVGHGNSLLRLEPRTGDVLERSLVSGPVAGLQRVDARTVAVTVRHSAGLLERFTLQDGVLQERVRFGAAPATFGYLRAEARVADPAARLRRDPTNPWLHLALGLTQAPEAARATFRRAIGAAETFYDLAGLATVLEEVGAAALAAEAFDDAMRDFAARGYDPRLLRDARLEAAYNFPLTPLRAALRGSDDLSAGFWAERLLLAAPEVPGVGAALGDYAALLRAVAPPEDADLWARRAALSTDSGPNALDRAVTALARSGWAVSLALLSAFLALHLTLLAKYARARRADRAQAGRTHSSRAPWLFAVRYATLSEKVVLLLVLAAALASAALGSWHGSLRPLPSVLVSGTLLSRPAQVYLVDADLRGPSGAFIQSYAAQSAGDEAEARTLLARAGAYAPALNNLGVATGDAKLYQRALALEPDLAAARYNLGETAALPFHARYRPGPALATPTARDFQNATTGTWQTALARAFTAPQLSFPSAPPFVPATVFGLALWRATQLLFLLIAFVTVVFLFVPRPRSVHEASRPWSYELLALLVPGSGLADEAWGVFLLVPWAVLGLGALSHLFDWGGELGLAPTTLVLVLSGIYLLNTVAVTVEGLAYRSRRRAPQPRRTGRA